MLRKHFTLTNFLVVLLVSGFALSTYGQRPFQKGTSGDLNTTEIISKRTRNAKTFQESNGQFRSTISGGALHYQDTHQEWQNINTDVVPSLDPGFQFENTTNGIRSYFPAVLSQQAGVKVSSDGGDFTLGHAFQFSLDNELESPFAESPIEVNLNQAPAQLAAANKVVYDNGNPMGYVEYLVGKEEVKQQFVLNQLPAGAAASGSQYFSMTEELSLPIGWTMRADGQTITGSQSAQGALSIYNDQGSLVQMIPVPEVFEQNNPSQILHPDGRMDQSFFVEQNGNAYKIRTAIPMAWLADANRSFPVVIDPNSVLPGGWGGWLDVTVNTVQANPSGFVFVGALSGTDHLAWVQYDVSSVTDNVTVDSVVATFFQNNSGSASTPTTVDVNDVTGDLGPYPAGFNLVPLADFGNGFYSSFVATGTGNYTLNLGTQAAIDMQCSLVRDTFQVALSNGNQVWKRFSSGSCSIDVYYGSCTPAPAITEIFHQDLTCANNFGSVTLAATGTGPFTYNWVGLAGNGPSQTTLSAGNYAVFATDTSTNCASGYCVVILAAEALEATLTGTDLLCNGDSNGTAAVTSIAFGTAPYTYTWSNGDSTASIANLGTGTYDVVVVDTFGCTDTATVAIAEPVAMVAAGTVNANATCLGINDGGATVNVTGGNPAYSYLWSNADTNATISNVAPGTYMVTVLDSNGCSAMDTVTIASGPGISGTVTLDSGITCNGLSTGGVTATATGGSGYLYLWSNSATTASLTGLSGGTYSVTVTASSGCQAIDSVTVIEPAALVSNIAVGNSVTCNGGMDGSASVSPTGGDGNYQVLWSNSSMNDSVSGLQAGFYNITIVDGNGCTTFDSVTIVEPTAIATGAMIVDSVSCFGLNDGSASASASGGVGGFSYLWNTSDTSSVLSGLAAGMYYVTAIDSNGCSATDTLTINQPSAIDVAVAATGADITANLAGASYQWLDCDNGFAPIANATSQTFTAVASGNYAVEIMVGGCSDTSACTNVTVVGLNGFESNPGFSLYPNPASQSVKMSVTGQLMMGETMTVYSPLGYVVLQKQIEFEQEELDVDHFANGIYLVEYRGEVRKLVIRK